MAATAIRDKYFLRTLHQEIGLVDRKIAHLVKYDTFPSEKERDQAVGKLNSQRNLLVRDARLLVESGIEYKPSDLPASLRPADEPLPTPVPTVNTAEPAFEVATVARVEGALEPGASAPADIRKEIQDYIAKRRRAPSTARA